MLANLQENNQGALDAGDISQDQVGTFFDGVRAFHVYIMCRMVTIDLFLQKCVSLDFHRYNLII